MLDGIWYVLEYGRKQKRIQYKRNNPLSNIDVVKQVCSWFGISDYESHIEFVENRLGQDARYSINSSKIEDCDLVKKIWKGIN